MATVDVVNPFNGSIVGKVPRADIADCLSAVNRADAAFESWRATAPRARAEMLRKAWELMMADHESLARTIVHERIDRVTEVRPELAPDRFEFAYRYAESFYDLEKPDWELALKLWSALEEKATTPIERQTMRLHAANILIKLDRRDHARALLATVDVPELQGQKQRLAPQLEAKSSP